MSARKHEERWYFDDNNVLYCHRTQLKQMSYLKYGMHVIYAKPNHNTAYMQKVIWHTTTRYTDLPIYVLNEPLW